MKIMGLPGDPATNLTLDNSPPFGFLDLDENQLVERHLGVIDSTQRWTWTAQIDREAWTIDSSAQHHRRKTWADESASADIDIGMGRSR